MKQTEPDFWVLEYVTITKDPRTDLVVAIGGTEKAADILQRTGGFLSAPGPRGDYHRLPHGLPVEKQRLKATIASHALLAAGHSVYLDPALNALATADGEHEAALRYLAHLAERVAAAETSSEVAEVLTEVAAPVNGLLPLTREVVVRAWTAANDLHGASPGEEPDPIVRLGDTANSLSQAASLILHARNHAARAPRTPAPAPPPSSTRPPRPPGGVDPRETYMANLADEYGTDVEIYIKALTTTIHADTPTGAPARLHDLLEQLDLERHEYPTGGPIYIWHTVPEQLDADEQKQLATRAIPALLLAGYEVNCTPEVFDEAAYRQAVRDIRTRAARPTAQHPAPASSPSRPAPARRTP